MAAKQREASINFFNKEFPKYLLEQEIDDSRVRSLIFDQQDFFTLQGSVNVSGSVDISFITFNSVDCDPDDFMNKCQALSQYLITNQENDFDVLSFFSPDFQLGFLTFPCGEGYPINPDKLCSQLFSYYEMRDKPIESTMFIVGQEEVMFCCFPTKIIDNQTDYFIDTIETESCLVRSLKYDR